VIIKTIQISIKRYKSAKEIIYSFFSKNTKSLKFLEEIVDANKVIYLNKKLKIKEIIFYLENKQKIWAYCRIYKNTKNNKNNKREIHYWFSKNKNLKIYDIASIFGHEISHAVGIKSEDTANKYATVSAFVLTILLQNFKKELIKE